MQQRDYIERMIQQVAAAIAAVLGAAAAGRDEDAERDLAQAWSALGVRRADVLLLDGSTVRALLGVRTEMAARLIETQASLEQTRGDSVAASRLRARAATLRGN
jgi:hypothetical protein